MAMNEMARHANRLLLVPDRAQEPYSVEPTVEPTVETGAATIRLAVLYAHLTLAQAIGAALGARAGIEVVGTGTCDRWRDSHIRGADVILVDIDMDAGRAIRMIAEITSEAPRARIVVAASNPSVTLCQQALSAGAAGFADKSTPLEQLVDTVRAAAANQATIPASLLTQVMDRMTTRRNEPNNSGLTRRELDVLRLCSEGHATAAIAARLFVSNNTVRTHIQNILMKLHAHSRLEAVAQAISAGLIEPAVMAER